MQAIHFTLAAGALAALAVVPAPAQQEQSGQSRRQQQGQEQQQQDQENWSDQQGSQMRRGQRGGSGDQSGVIPLAWVRVAYDYDDDGAWDAVEYIYAWDLEEAKRASQGRQGQQGQQGQQGRSNRTAGGGQSRFQSGQGRSQRDQGRMSAMSRQHELQGTVQSLTTKTYFGAREPHVFGRVRTSDGRTARVDFGPRSQVSQQLQEGERVTVTGRRGTLNGQGTFMAEEVETGGRTIQVDRDANTDGGDHLRRIRGTLRSTRRVSFRESGQPHVLGLVETGGRSSGRMQQNQRGQQSQRGQRVQQGRGDLLLVDLGPQNQLSDLSLRQGTEIMVLATPGKLQGEQAMIAESVCVDGQTVDVRRHAGARRSIQGSGSGSGTGSGTDSGTSGSR